MRLREIVQIIETWDHPIAEKLLEYVKKEEKALRKERKTNLWDILQYIASKYDDEDIHLLFSAYSTGFVEGQAMCKKH